jgi:hypothetical protein
VPPLATPRVPVVDASGMERFKEEVASDETTPLVPKRRPEREPRVKELEATKLEVEAVVAEIIVVEAYGKTEAVVEVAVIYATVGLVEALIVVPLDESHPCPNEV